LNFKEGGQFHDQPNDCWQFNKHFSLRTQWVHRIIKSNIQWLTEIVQTATSACSHSRIGDRGM